MQNHVFKVTYKDMKNNIKVCYMNAKANNVRRAWHIAVTWANNLTFNLDVDIIVTIEYMGVA